MLPWRRLLQPVTEAPRWQHINEKTERRRRGRKSGEINGRGEEGLRGSEVEKRESEKNEGGRRNREGGGGGVEGRWLDGVRNQSKTKKVLKAQT